METKFGRQIRTLRAERDMSQAQLAEATGIPRTDISRFETGRMIPTTEEVARIKVALNWPENAAEAFAILAPTTEATP